MSPEFWEALRTSFTGVSATAAAIRVALDWLARHEEIPKEHEAEVLAEGKREIDRAVTVAQAAPLPVGYEKTTVQLASMLDALKKQSDDIRDRINRTISDPGLSNWDRRRIIRQLDLDYCTMIGSMIDTQPNGALTQDILDAWDHCKAKYSSLS